MVCQHYLMFSIFRLKYKISILKIHFKQVKWWIINVNTLEIMKMKRFQNKIRNVCPLISDNRTFIIPCLAWPRDICTNSNLYRMGRQKKYSVKMAVRILLELGLKRYVLEQINLAAKEENRARAEGNEPTEPTDFIKDMRKKSRKMGLPPIVWHSLECVWVTEKLPSVYRKSRNGKRMALYFRLCTMNLKNERRCVYDAAATAKSNAVISV